MDTKITGVNPTDVSTVWDALNPDGTLKPEFDTQQNRENWVLMQGEDYKTFKIKLNKLIVIGHGDYDNLRGMAAKRYILGRALAMFRTWMARYAYTRYGGVETDIELGYVTKGRYRSFTPGSASMGGAALGTILLPGVGTVIGGAAGFGMGYFFGAEAGSNFFDDLLFNSKQMLRKLAFQKTEYDQRYSEVDAANMRSNLTELTIVLSLFTAFLLTKMVLWDDDDEKDDPKRKAHNLLANYLMRGISDITMFTSPDGVIELQDNALSILGFFERLGRLGKYTYKRILGQHIIPTGYNAGEDGFINAIEDAVLPNIFVGLMELNPSLGYDKMMKHQFQRSEWDKFFYSEKRLAKDQKMRNNAKKKADARKAEKSRWWETD
jgi:hypothetical protein